jgi:hypothetical protein
MTTNVLNQTKSQRQLAATVFLFLVFLACNSPAHAQVRGGTSYGGTSAQGTLTVTATVVTSVGVITGPNGEQKVVIANAADPADNVSWLQTAPANAPSAGQTQMTKRCEVSGRQSSSGPCSQVTIQPVPDTHNEATISLNKHRD